MDFDFDENYVVNYVNVPSCTILDIDLEPNDEDAEARKPTILKPIPRVGAVCSSIH